MTDQTVTQLVIDSSGASAGADQYAASMDKIEAAAQKTLGALADIKGAISDQTLAMQNAAAANDNYTTSHMHVGDALRVGAKAAIDYTAGALATAGAVGIGILAFGELLAVLSPIILAYKLSKDAVDLLTEAWQLGGQQLESYRQIAQKAAELDLSTSYFQRLTKGAEAAKLPVDQLTDSLKTLQRQTADQLGGSALQQRLTASIDAGNFANNPGVDQLAHANSLQEKFAAITMLVHQAMQDGQRLAAIDITNTALGSQAADNLRQDSEYFDKLGAAAAKISDTQIVSDADIGRATALKVQYDAAVSILETRWHPVQDVLTQLGVQMHESWVGIVVSIADAVDGAEKLVEQILKVDQSDLSKFWSTVQTGANALGKFAIDNFTTPESRAAAEQSSGITVDPAASRNDPTPASMAYGAAVDKLRAGLQNQNAVQQAVNQTNAVAQAVYGDTSHKIDTTTKSTDDLTNAYTRALNASQRKTAEMSAEIAGLGLGSGALEEYKTRALLTTAAQQAGIPITRELTAQIDAQSKAAGVTADALARMKVSTEIKFASQTSLLSPEDLKIATQLESIYGNDVPAALNSSQAAAIRFNDTLKSMNDLARSSAATFGTDLVSGLEQGKSLMASLGNAATNLSKSLTSKAFTDLFSGNFAQAGIEGVGAIITGIFGANEQEKEAEAQAAADALTRIQQFNQESASALLDTSTLMGQLAQLQIQQTAAEQAEITAGGQAINALEQDYANQRLAIIQKAVTSDQAAFDQLVTQAQTATGQAVAALTSATTNLAQALTALGKGIGSLSDGVTTAVGQLQANFAQGLVDKINSAGGEDYLSSIAALVTQHRSDLADAATLGISSALVDTSFDAQVQKIIDDSQLTGDAFTELAQVFPGLTSNVHAFTGATQASASALTSFITATEKFREGLLVNTTLSSLSPQDQLTLAQSQFRNTLAAAEGGDATAQGNLQDDATTYLNEAKAFYASNAQYAAVFQEVQDSLTSAENSATSQLTIAQAQLQQLVNLNASVALLVASQGAAGTIAGVVDTTAANTSAAQNVNASAAAAAAAIEAAKTWHYPVVDPYAAGGLKQGWTDADYSLYRAAHPEAHYLMGGLVTNGTYNQDSVSAQLAGGEFMTRAPSVTPQTLPVLQYINQTGALPNNDNDDTRRVLASGFNNSTSMIIAALEDLGERIDRVEKAVSKGSGVRPAPGGRHGRIA